jgi:hypothetical protein
MSGDHSHMQVSLVGGGGRSADEIVSHAAAKVRFTISGRSINEDSGPVSNHTGNVGGVRLPNYLLS